MLPWTRVRVIGPSMEPTMSNGEWWVVRRTRSVRPGDVILLTHPARRDALVVKRVAQADEGGWWVLGDNLAESEDSRHFGPVPPENVVGRLWFRYGRD